MAHRNPHDDTPDGLDAELARLIGGTGDPLDDPDMLRALAKLRLALGQDVIFVSRFRDGMRILELVESAPGTVSFLQGSFEPLERSWCYSVVAGRLPEFVLDARSWIESGAVPAPPLPIGTHLSTPVQLADGTVYGTLCAFSGGVTEGASPADLARLRMAAQALAQRLSQAGAGGPPH